VSLNPFLEERIPIDVQIGATYGDDYEVVITKVAGGAEYRSLTHPFPIRRFTLDYSLLGVADLWTRVVNLYHRAYKSYAGFRVKCLDDFTTNGTVTAPTHLDQTLTLISTGIYQLRKAYGSGAASISLGYPERTIYKPVTGTVLIGVSTIVIPVVVYTVDTVTGQVTFAATKTGTITAITQASSAVVTIGAHTMLVNESVYFAAVAGMTQINGQRGLITAIAATTITVAINSTGYGVYTSAGTANTHPQAGETVTGGCEFDIPCRFDSILNIEMNYPNHRDSGPIELVELIAP